jgi:hypothetical protein
MTGPDTRLRLHRYRPLFTVRVFVLTTTYAPYVSNKQSGCACPHLKAVISAGCIAQTQECWALRRPGFSGARQRESRIVSMRRHWTNMSQVRRSQEVVTGSTRREAFSAQQSAFSGAGMVGDSYESRAGSKSSTLVCLWTEVYRVESKEISHFAFSPNAEC